MNTTPTTDHTPCNTSTIKFARQEHMSADQLLRDQLITGETTFRPALQPNGTVKHAKQDLKGYRMGGTGKLVQRANGTIDYVMPDWCKVPKPFTMPKEITARVEKTSAKTYERLHKFTCGLMAKYDKTQVSRKVGSMVGRECADWYRMAATNGHVALIDKLPADKNKGMPIAYIGDLKGYKLVAELNDSEVHCAIQRASVVMSERSRGIKLSYKDMVLTVSSGSVDPDCAFDAEFWCDSPIKTWSVVIDYNYLEPVFGVWPLNVWWKDNVSAVVFEPVDKSWRYVVMPIRY